jgi:hypothetical protein
MKVLLFIIAFSSHLALADFGKPKLLARMSDRDSWNVPENTWCFTSEPAVVGTEVFLGCLDYQGTMMVKWSPQFEIVSRAKEGNLLSWPVASFGKISWYEFNEFTVEKFSEWSGTLKETSLSEAGPLSGGGDSFQPLTQNAWIFRAKGSSSKLYQWKEGETSVFFDPKASYLFGPVTGPSGETVIKAREKNLDESAPDKLWLYTHAKGWSVVLEDRDSNPTSQFVSFRHQVSVDGDRVLVLANDGHGEGLYLLEEGKITLIARAGVELKRFDYFSPRLRGGTIVVRGEDFEGRKVLYVKDEGRFRPLLTQGDIVHTDRGFARVHYKDQNALFYGAPGIDGNGSVYIQATLTDADFPSTLLGVGLILFHKE